MGVWSLVTMNNNVGGYHCFESTGHKGHKGQKWYIFILMFGKTNTIM